MSPRGISLRMLNFDHIGTEVAQQQVIGAAYTALTSNTRVPVNGGLDPLGSSPEVVGPATSSVSAPSASDVIPPSLSGNLLQPKTIHQFCALPPSDPCASNEEEGESEDNVDGE